MSDFAARNAALDPSRSFIVQAPAGSGKTELLIQRYLSLLATVQQPEQVVAITFTRKAAAEMRRRVQRALHAAAAGDSGAHAHEQLTLRLAAAVVARDRELEWGLLIQPQRLRVDTLDALNVWLARQLPVLAGGVAAADIIDKADEHYRAAARQTIAALTTAEHDLATALGKLLASVDNDAEQLERLLAALLPRRDQWLPRFAGSRPEELQSDLESALQRLVDDELAALAALCDASWFAEMMPLLRHAAGAAAEPLRTRLAAWLAIDHPPTTGPLALEAWRGVAALLLTREGQWRKRFAKPEGFGPEHVALRDRCRELVEHVRHDEPLRAALALAATLPDAHYTATQWQQLEALQRVLVHLAAELKLSFAARSVVDFVELALAAQRALGAADAPSELLLALDRRIQHLLVDEFQDTSTTQIRLLELLTSGWQNDDGRTLFLVGDPMQSIYRFRDADMSLFLRTKERGIGQLSLTSLTLDRNFRSAPAIVHWVNEVFRGVFPPEDRLGSGAAAFRASVAVRGDDSQQFVRCAPASPNIAGAEAARVVELLRDERSRTADQSIAVLVQSRTHLVGLRERLRREQWPVHAVEIDSLSELQVAHDLAGLTRALLHAGDRVAWLGVLRAPWCGLEWADLHALCHDAPRRTVWDLMHENERCVRLSVAGQQRLRAVAATLHRAFATRDAATLARWVESTWTALGGPLCLDEEAERLAARQFFALLRGLERDGDLDDPARLHLALEAAQPQADPPRERGIEIMTMHRAKGLEFDTVILLGLGREPRPDDAQALQWLGRVANDGHDDLLMVPMATAADERAARLSDFVRRAERQRDAAERARLLYVASTRARERLYLVWEPPSIPGKPHPGTLLAHLWPTLGITPDVAPTAPSDESRVEPWTPVLRRLAEPMRAPPSEREVAPPTAPSNPARARPEFAWAGQVAAHIGTVVHRYLQRVAEQGLDRWSATTVRAAEPAFAAQLRLLGVERDDLPAATARVSAALLRALDDPNGRWILGPHAEARSELRLTVRVGPVLEHLRLDRTFVADGRRWIVDFKTSLHEGGDIETFLDNEVARYRPQLERYATALAAIDPSPLQLGLYFPLLAELRTWPLATTSPST